jgi:hypothetical protein
MKMGLYEVLMNGKSIGIVVSNLPYEMKYWTERAMKTGNRYALLPVLTQASVYPYKTAYKPTGQAAIKMEKW